MTDLEGFGPNMNEVLDFPLELLDAEYYLPVDILGMTTCWTQDSAGNILYFNFHGVEQIPLWCHGNAIKVKVSRVIQTFLWMVEYPGKRYLWAGHPCIKLPPQSEDIDFNKAYHEAG